MTASSRPLRIRCVGCEVLARPLYWCAARSRNVVDVALLRRRLHDTPATLRERIQAEIESAEASEADYDVIALAYGLCGGSTAGIRARRLPVVVPRAHDCITIFLGSRDRYAQEFRAHPGTYWFEPDYMERSELGWDDSHGGLLGIGAGSDDALKRVHADYVARFGPDNADYLMNELGAWMRHYDRAVFISTGGANSEQAELEARRRADERGWQFERRAADLVLLERLMDADWEDDFLVLQPGQELAMTFDDGVLGAIAADAAGNEGV